MQCLRTTPYSTKKRNSILLLIVIVGSVLTSCGSQASSLPTIPILTTVGSTTTTNTAATTALVPSTLATTPSVVATTSSATAINSDANTSSVTSSPAQSSNPIPTLQLTPTLANLTKPGPTVSVAATLPTIKPTQAPPTSGSAVNGQQLFIAQGCIACHGQMAQGDYGPKIAGTKLTYLQVLAQVRNPKNIGDKAMTPYDAQMLPDVQVADIYRYLQSLK